MQRIGRCVASCVSRVVRSCVVLSTREEKRAYRTLSRARWSSAGAIIHEQINDMLYLAAMCIRIPLSVRTAMVCVRSLPPCCLSSSFTAKLPAFKTFRQHPSSRHYSLAQIRCFSRTHVYNDTCIQHNLYVYTFRIYRSHSLCYTPIYVYMHTHMSAFRARCTLLQLRCHSQRLNFARKLCVPELNFTLLSRIYRDSDRAISLRYRDRYHERCRDAF